jgi:cytochrome c-type biogenesis protein CcmH/NrfG
MKMTFRVAQVALVLAVVALTVLIFMRGRQNAATVTKESNDLKTKAERPNKRNTRGGAALADASKFNLKAYRQKQVNNLPDSAQKTFGQLPEITSGSDTLTEHRYVAFWQEVSNPLLAGYYQQRLARQADLPGTWTRAGQFFQKAQKKTKDSLAKAFAVSKALKAFKKALDKNPDHLDAKAGLALTYIEGKRQVMKGVGLLKEVVKADPNHRKALFYLGMLSIRSGQYKKARERFQKLVELQPKNPFNHLYLGNVEEQLNNKDAALKEYKKYKKLVNQPSLKANANEKINALKSSQKN